VPGAPVISTGAVTAPILAAGVVRLVDLRGFGPFSSVRRCNDGPAM
jgi:hypothetical protein